MPDQTRLEVPLVKNDIALVIKKDDFSKFSISFDALDTKNSSLWQKYGTK